MKKLRVLYCGTPDFSVPTLDMLLHHPAIDLIGIVTMPDRPAGRGQELKSPEVAVFAKAHRLPLVQTENINGEEIALSDWERQGIDAVVVLAFAQFLGKRILALPRLGCFNIHTSLLPKYRGAAPIQYALWNGDSVTGVTIQKMVTKMDAGDIVHEHTVTIAPDENGGQLTTRLKFQAALACNDFINNLVANKITYRPQDESRVSFAPTLKKLDGYLDFATSSTEQIKNRIRAMDPWPGTFCFLVNKRLKVLRVEIVKDKVAAGKVTGDDGRLLVGCTDGTLRLSYVQLEGKKAGTDRDLLNGLRDNLVLTPPKEFS